MSEYEVWRPPPEILIDDVEIKELKVWVAEDGAGAGYVIHLSRPIALEPDSALVEVSLTEAREFIKGLLLAAEAVEAANVEAER